jgi:hypothetical protein
MTVSTILLIPAPGDPHGLLADGVCGGRVPTMIPCSADERVPSRQGATWHVAGPPCREHPRTRALVLAHAGKAVPIGVFAAWYIADSTLTKDSGGYEGLSVALHDGLLDVVEWARNLTRDGAPLGRLVLLDADGREVRP